MITELKTGGCVRITILTSCQSGCDFCHLEGHKSVKEIGTLNPAIASWKQSGKLDNLTSMQDIQNAIDIAKAMNLIDVNLTGGEPTLHPQILEIIRTLNEAKLSVAMTTHAEIAPERFIKLLNSGLEWMIVSLHALEPEQYVAMDLVAQDLEKKHSHATALKYASARLKNKLANIDLAVAAQKSGAIKGVITNTVLMNLEQTKGIIAYCNARGILPRVQRDLNNRVAASKSVNELVNALNAICVKDGQAIGDSSGAGFDYTYISALSGLEESFRLKDFGDVYIDKMCDTCTLKDTDNCRERFYGIRVEPSKVRTCIDLERENQTVFSPQEFIKQIQIPGTVPENVFKQYAEAKTCQS